MEIGISRGNFQVVRIHPTPDTPDGSWVLRFIDPSGITVIVGMSHEQGLQFRDGFTVPEDTPAARLVLPDDAEVRHLGKAEPTAKWVGESEPQEAPAAS